jgi:hypothetical protein
MASRHAALPSALTGMHLELEAAVILNRLVEKSLQSEWAAGGCRTASLRSARWKAAVS